MNKEIEKNSLHRGEELLDAIGDIKDEYVIEAGAEELAGKDAVSTFTVIEGSANETTLTSAGARNKRRTWMKFVSAAAVLVLCVGVGSMAIKLAGKKGMEETPAETPVEAPAPAPEPAAASAMEPSSESDSVSEEVNTAEEPASFDDFAKEEHERAEEAIIIDDPDVPYEPIQGEAFVLTAGQWNDNDNWPFFVNLVNSGIIEFPSFGIDPRNRIKVTLLNEDGSDSIKNEAVYLKDGAGNILWQTKSNGEGIAYLFYEGGYDPFSVEAGGTTLNLESMALNTPGDSGEEGDQQGTPIAAPTPDDIVMNLSGAGEATSGVQVMFIVDTTGSMGDELVYLQMDFMQIAEDTAGEGVMYSANFYRDEGDVYVTKTNSFTSDASEVQSLISDEFATGGGDEPEAVADILYETITTNSEWRSDMNKVCFLIFDAPPHYGTEDRIIEAVESAAARGIHIVPVVASNAQRETELFGRALAICTDGEYVFLTDDSGVGYSHLEPIIGDYDVELLHDIIVRIINSYK